MYSDDTIPNYSIFHYHIWYPVLFVLIPIPSHHCSMLSYMLINKFAYRTHFGQVSLILILKLYGIVQCIDAKIFDITYVLYMFCVLIIIMCIMHIIYIMYSYIDMYMNIV